MDQTEQDQFDKIYSGPFLIKGLMHNFETASNSHRMVITAMKDSLPLELPAAGRAPSTSGPGGIIDPIDQGWA